MTNIHQMTKNHPPHSLGTWASCYLNYSLLSRSNSIFRRPWENWDKNMDCFMNLCVLAQQPCSFLCVIPAEVFVLPKNSCSIVHCSCLFSATQPHIGRLCFRQNCIGWGGKKNSLNLFCARQQCKLSTKYNFTEEETEYQGRDWSTAQRARDEPWGHSKTHFLFLLFHKYLLICATCFMTVPKCYPILLLYFIYFCLFVCLTDWLTEFWRQVFSM